MGSLLSVGAKLTISGLEHLKHISLATADLITVSGNFVNIADKFVSIATTLQATVLGALTTISLLVGTVMAFLFRITKILRGIVVLLVVGLCYSLIATTVPFPSCSDFSW